MHQERAYPGRVSGTGLTNPDFAKFIEAFGGHGEVVSDTAEFSPAFRRAVASGRPAVIELRMNPEQITTRATIAELRAGRAAKPAAKPKRAAAPQAAEAGARRDGRQEARWMSFGLAPSARCFGRPIEASPVALMQAARAYLARDHAGGGTRCLALIEREPRHFDALHLLGVVCLDRGHLADAIGYLTRAVCERPDDAQANYHLGTALLGLKLTGRRSSAAARGRAAARRHGALNNLGNALAGSGRHDEAIDVFVACWRSMPAMCRHASISVGRCWRWTGSTRRWPTFSAALAHAPADIDPDRLADIHAESRRRRWSVSGAMTRRSPLSRHRRASTARGGVERESDPAAARPLRRGLAEIRRPLGRRRP